MQPRKNDVLASNLLFITLFISLAERLFWAITVRLYLPNEPVLLWPGSGISLLLLTLVEAAFFYAIRRGMFRAKVAVAAVWAYLAYAGTHLHYGYLAGVAFYSLWGWPLLVLLQNLLTLAALVLMFTKSRESQRYSNSGAVQ